MALYDISFESIIINLRKSKGGGLAIMKWQGVRELFLNQFLLVSILDYHEKGDKKIVDEVAPIRTISEKNANKEFIRAK